MKGNTMGKVGRTGRKCLNPECCNFINPRLNSRRRYCSNECYYESITRLASIRVFERTCKKCGREFTTNVRNKPNCNTCGKEKRNKAAGKLCKCGKVAIESYRGEYLCEACLNPPISPGYLEWQRQFYSGIRKSSLADICEQKDTGATSMGKKERKEMTRAANRIQKEVRDGQ
jgi:hypothetical protein